MLPIDLGTDPRRSRLFGSLQTLGILVFLGAVASFPLTVGLETWLTHRTLTAEWTARGPDCPVAPAVPISLQGAKPPPPFVYMGVGFAHQIGDVSCAPVPEKSLFSSVSYPVCQFDAPSAIAVTLAGRTTVFTPGIGHGATVTVHNGKLTCALSRGMFD